MKKGLALLLTGLLAVTSIPAAAVDIGEVDMTKGTTDWNNPESYVYNNDTGVPDKGLYEAAVKYGDQDKDGLLTVAEAKETGQIISYTYGSGTINSLTGMEHFQNLERLEASLSDGAYSRAGGVSDLSPLKNLTKLERLSIKCSSELTDLSPLAGLDNLYWVTLDDITDIKDFSPLKHAGITTLQLNAPEESFQPLPAYNSLVDAVQGMPRLNALTLSRFVIPDAAPLLELPQLKELYFIKNDHTYRRTPDGSKIEKVSAISNPAPLERLYLSTIPDISWLSKFTATLHRELWIDDLSQLTTLSAIADLKELGLLHLNIYNEVDDSLLKSIGVMENLRNFSSSGPLDAKSIQDLTEISRFAPNANRVNLACSSLKGLDGFKNLKALHTSGALLTSLDGIEAVADTLEELAISNSGLTSLNGVEKLPNLREMYISYNRYLTTLPDLSNAVNLGKNLGNDEYYILNLQFFQNQLSAEELTAKLPKHFQELSEWPEWLKDNADDVEDVPESILPKPGAQEDGSYVVNLDQPDQNDGHRFSVNLPEGMVDESKGLTLKVTPQTTSSAAVKAEAEKENCEIQHGFDLSLEYTDGTKVEYTPGKLMTVSIYSLEIVPGRAYRIFRENDDGSVDVIIPSYVGHGIMQFKTDHFSHYSWGIVKNAPVVPDRPSRPSGSSGGSYSYSSRIDENWIFVRSQGMGSVTPGDCTVYDGEDKTFTFMPDEGYKVGKVLLDGEEIPTDGKSYTLRDITAPHTLTVIFARDTADEASKPVDPVKPNVTENAQTGDAWWKLW